MRKSIQADRWNKAKPVKSERNGYWVLWPMVFLFLFWPSWHRPLAALPLVILAVARERSAVWAWHGEAFWVALALFSVALIGAEPIDLIWVLQGGVSSWVAARPEVLVLPVLGGCGIIAKFFASVRERGWASAGRHDRLEMGARSANNAGVRQTSKPSLMTNSAFKPSNPELKRLLTLQMEKSVRFKELSDQHTALIKQGEQIAADRLRLERDQAKQDYDTARNEFQRAKAQSR